MAEEGWTCWAKGFVAVSEWRVVALTYMYGRLRASGFAWLSGGLGGFQGHPGPQPGDRVRPSVWGIWIGMGDEEGTRAGL